MNSKKLIKHILTFALIICIELILTSCEGIFPFQENKSDKISELTEIKSQNKFDKFQKKILILEKCNFEDFRVNLSSLFLEIAAYIAELHPSSSDMSGLTRKNINTLILLSYRIKNSTNSQEIIVNEEAAIGEIVCSLRDINNKHYNKSANIDRKLSIIEEKARKIDMKNYKYQTIEILSDLVNLFKEMDKISHNRN